MQPPAAEREAVGHVGLGADGVISNWLTDESLAE
jgi:hypothetical protein